MTRQGLERHQVWFYLLAILMGLAVGAVRPDAGMVLERLLWPTLVLLLYTTFLQTPLLHVHDALRDRRFAAAMLLGNFVAVPLMVWALVAAFDFEPAARLGVLLVLLVPCTDWFITFAQAGRGDVVRAVVATPLNLLLQLLCLPFYLWLMADARVLDGWSAAAILPAALVVLAPLAVAAVSQAVLARRPQLARLQHAAAWGPVPLLAIAVFLVAGAHAGAVMDGLPTLVAVVPLFIAFLVLVPVLARLIASRFGLPVEQGRTLVFSLGTRNSFVVLPLALSLPPEWEAAALVVVTQSLVELAGMAVYVWAVPRLVFPDGRGRTAAR